MSSATARTRLRNALPLVLLAVAVFGAVALGGRPAEEGPPLDPDNPGPRGTKALVETLRVLGATVDVVGDVPAEPDTVALVLADALTDEQREGLERWVAAGGRLVVADPFSPLSAEPEDLARVGFTRLVPDCDVDALAAIERVTVPGTHVLEAPEGAAACFPVGDGHWLVAQPQGDGVVVSLGGPEAWTNRRIGDADNAVAAAALLAPTGAETVAILRPALPGEGEATLADVLDPRVLGVLLQLGVAFMVFAAWRARRLGPPVAEPQPVEIPGAELVVAAGNLLHRSRARGRAAAVLRDDLRATLRRRLGIPADVADETLINTAAGVGLDPDRLASVLGGPDPADDRGLAGLARDVEDLRRQAVAPIPEGAQRAL